jgi:hypothetical protein
MAQLNMSETKSDDAFEIGNNCKTCQEKNFEELCVEVNKFL